MTALLCLSQTAVAADVFEDQANHQVRQRLLRLRRQGSPVWHPWLAAVAWLGEQVELLWSGPKDMMRVALASHGHLPDSRRERSSLPSQP
jgi:hypothetical protein